MEVIAQEEHDLQKVRIFLGVCGLYKGEEVNVDGDLCARMLEYITTQETVTDK